MTTGTNTGSNTVAEAVAKAIGFECYTDAALTFSGGFQALTGLNGSLLGGTTYSFTNATDPIILPAGFDSGEKRWENSSDIEISFSKPVRLLVAAVGSGDANILDPIVWSVNNGGNQTFLIADAGTLTYNPATVDAQIAIPPQPPIRAEATLLQGAAPTATQNWGELLVEGCTSILVHGVDAEALRFAVQEVDEPVGGEVRKAFACELPDGSVEYRDSVTNDIVALNDFNRRVCPVDVVAPDPEVGGSTTLTDGQTFTIPANAKSFAVAPNDAASSFNLVGGNYNTIGCTVSLSVGAGNSEEISNSGDAVVAATGTVQIVWEV